MLEKATVLTTLFTRVDDVMKGSAMIQDALERPGPAPRLTDSELVTSAIYQELIGEPREDHFFRLHQVSLLPFFPGLVLPQPLQPKKAGSLVCDPGGADQLADRAGCPPMRRDGAG